MRHNITSALHIAAAAIVSIMLGCSPSATTRSHCFNKKVPFESGATLFHTFAINDTNKVSIGEIKAQPSCPCVKTKLRKDNPSGNIMMDCTWDIKPGTIINKAITINVSKQEGANCNNYTLFAHNDFGLFSANDTTKLTPSLDGGYWAMIDIALVSPIPLSESDLLVTSMNETRISICALCNLKNYHTYRLAIKLNCKSNDNKTLKVACPKINSTKTIAILRSN